MKGSPGLVLIGKRNHFTKFILLFILCAIFVETSNATPVASGRHKLLQPLTNNFLQSQVYRDRFYQHNQPVHQHMPPSYILNRSHQHHLNSRDVPNYLNCTILYNDAKFFAKYLETNHDSFLKEEEGMSPLNVSELLEKFESACDENLSAQRSRKGSVEYLIPVICYTERRKDFPKMLQEFNYILEELDKIRSDYDQESKTGWFRNFTATVKQLKDLINGIAVEKLSPMDFRVNRPTHTETYTLYKTYMRVVNRYLELIKKECSMSSP